MQVKEIITILEREKELKLIDLKNRKNNINHDYVMAQLDFKVIENIEDVIDTLNDVIDKLDNCQERIIERNNQRIYY